VGNAEEQFFFHPGLEDRLRLADAEEFNGIVTLSRR